MRLMVGIVIGGLLGLVLFQNPEIVAAVESEWPLSQSLSEPLPEGAEDERLFVEADDSVAETLVEEAEALLDPAEALSDHAEALLDEPAEALLDEPAEALNTENAARGFQSAWMPFRSEASASGFARRLSDQLQRPIEVVRQGPGRYQVGFHYLSEEERRAVLSSIEFTTGYQVPKG
jgi:hypothetical protein